MDQIENIQQEALAEVEKIKDSNALHEWEGKYLGAKGAITSMLRTIGSLPKEERADFGKRANELKVKLSEIFAQREEIIHEHELARDLEEGQIDVTLPGRAHPTGGLHPSTQTLRELNRIWGDMGFQVYRSRDVE